MSKVLQISDTHIVPENQLAYETVDTAAALDDTVSTINRLLPQIGPIDLVLVTGDLTEHGTQEEYSRFKTLLGSLDVAYRAVPGNHDRRGTMRACFEVEEWMPASGPLNWSLDLDAFSVIALDSSVEDKAYGAFEPETLVFLERELDRLNDRPVLVGFHHPPLHVGIAPMDRNNLIKANGLEAAVSKYPGELRLVCGHLHRSIAGLFGSKLCQVCPGTSHAVTLDQRPENTNSLTVEPGGMMLHEWRDERFLSHLLPIGQFGGPHPFLGYD
ncbi:phosphodiesterase [Roseibium sp.]|uniref:phosphodiesterase n=1 Tax=Roseibium sp. TaxID=1936156 RepID=UPI003B50DC9A